MRLASGGKESPRAAHSRHIPRWVSNTYLHRAPRGRGVFAFACITGPLGTTVFRYASDRVRRARSYRRLGEHTHHVRPLTGERKRRAPGEPIPRGRTKFILANDFITLTLARPCGPRPPCALAHRRTQRRLIRNYYLERARALPGMFERNEERTDGETGERGLSCRRNETYTAPGALERTWGLFFLRSRALSRGEQPGEIGCFDWDARPAKVVAALIYARRGCCDVVKNIYAYLEVNGCALLSVNVWIFRSSR